LHISNLSEQACRVFSVPVLSQHRFRSKTRSEFWLEALPLKRRAAERGTK